MTTPEGGEEFSVVPESPGERKLKAAQERAAVLILEALREASAEPGFRAHGWDCRIELGGGFTFRIGWGVSREH